MGYSPWGHKESDMTEQTSTYMHIYFFCIPKSHHAEKVQPQKDLRGGFTEGANLLPRRQESGEGGIQVPLTTVEPSCGSREGGKKRKEEERKRRREEGPGQ